jgi:hypothetical protein
MWLFTSHGSTSLKALVWARGHPSYSNSGMHETSGLRKSAAKTASVCSSRTAATRVENIRTRQKTAPLRHPEFGLYKQNLKEVSKHKKRRC